MIKNPGVLVVFENDLVRRKPADYSENLRIAEALYREARSFGVFPLKDPLDSIEVDLNLARVLNSVRISSKKAGS